MSLIHYKENQNEQEIIVSTLSWMSRLFGIEDHSKNEILFKVLFQIRTPYLMVRHILLFDFSNMA